MTVVTVRQYSCFYGEARFLGILLATLAVCGLACAQQVGPMPADAFLALPGADYEKKTKSISRLSLAAERLALNTSVPDVSPAVVSNAATGSRLRRVSLASAASTSGGAAEMAESARLGLADLIGQAVQVHPEILSRLADSDAAKANQDAARWQYFPTPSLRVQQQRKEGGGVTVAALQQPLWSGGRLDAGVDAASARVRAADDATSETQYTVALRVTGAWQSWFQARGRSAALVKGKALLEVYAESVRRRIKGGVSPEADRELVESRLAQIEGDLSAARAAERSAISQLSQLVGRTLGTNEISAASPVVDSLPAFEILVDRAVDRSAVLRRLEAEIEAAHHDTLQKRAALFPTIGIRAEYQHANSSNTTAVESDSRVMLVMEFAPGAGLSVSSGLDASRARVVSLRENRETARRDLVSKIAADYEDHLSSLSRIESTRRTLKAAAAVLASYDRLFDAGKRSWLDVLNAAREMTQVDTSLADIEAQVAASYYRLRLHGSDMSWQDGGAQ